MARRITGHGVSEKGLEWDGIDLAGMERRYRDEVAADLRPVMVRIGAAAKASAKAEAENEFPTAEEYPNLFQVEVQQPTKRHPEFSIVLWNTHRVAHILEHGQKRNYYPIPGPFGSRIWYSEDYAEFGRMNGHHVLRIAVEGIAMDWFSLAGNMPLSQRPASSSKRTPGRKYRSPVGRFEGTRRKPPPMRRRTPARYRRS